MPHSLALPAAIAAALALVGCSSTTALPATAPSVPSQSPATADAPLEATADAETEGSAAESSASMDQESIGFDTGTPGLPAGSGASIDDVLRGGAMAMWAEQPDAFTLTVPTAPSCFLAVLGAEATSASQVTVEFVGAEGHCAEADSARTYLLEVPDGADAAGGLEVVVEGLADEAAVVALPAP